MSLQPNSGITMPEETRRVMHAALKKKKPPDGLAAQALETIQRLYRIEAGVRASHPDKRYQARQSRSRAILYSPIELARANDLEPTRLPTSRKTS